jgi:hypothetical protein
MRLREKLNEMKYKHGVPVTEMEFEIRDMNTTTIMQAVKYDRSYLFGPDEKGYYRAVPFHRVLYVYLGGEVIWTKNTRED